MGEAKPMADGEPVSFTIVHDHFIDEPKPIYDPVIRLLMYCQMNTCGKLPPMLCTYKSAFDLHYYCPSCKHRVKIEVSI